MTLLEENPDSSLDKGEFTEKEKETIKKNVVLLELKFGGAQTDEGIDEDITLGLLAIKRLESAFIPQGLETPIVLFYNTRTGDIGNPQGYFAEYSALRTSIVEGNDGSKEILLYRPGDIPSAAQYSAAIAGDDIPQHENRRILVERISPDRPHFVGRYESLGKSDYIEPPQGDWVILSSVQTFNRNHRSADDR